MNKYRILSFDGGGLRGLITARMLQRLNSDIAILEWMNKVNLLVGTSTGGILALGIAAGKKLEDICNLYKNKGKKIFDDSIWDNICDLGKTIGADYSNNALKSELRAFFGNVTLAQLGKKVAIPTFDLDNEELDLTKRSWKPKIFHNFAGNNSDGDNLASSIALYTSSAPTYFPSADGFIDGGVFANNPSLVALAQAISQLNDPKERANIDEVVLLSVGTGVNLTYITGNALDWGYAQWTKPLINILMDGVSGISDYQAKQLLGDRYHRLQVVFDPGESIPMDAVEKIDRMDQIGANYDFSKTKEWILKYWMDTPN